MGRKKESGAEDVIEIVSKFHWGIGVILAIASFLILHWYAGREITVVAGMENLSKNTVNSMLHVFASFGQVVLPGLFGIGAAISLFNRIKISSRSQSKVEKQNSTVPMCPKCGSEMVKRVAKKGKKAGEEFWGCSDFPRCRSILPYR